MRKVPALLLVIMLLSAILSVYAVTLNPFERNRTIVVPDDFSTIQAAVGNATAGDTVFVKKGTYVCDSFIISNPITLVGEAADETVIYGNYSPRLGFTGTIRIHSSNVSISNFRITLCVDPIFISSDIHSAQGEISNIRIIGNNFIDNFGNAIGGTLKNTLVYGNSFRNTNSTYSYPIWGSCTNSTISNNLFSDNFKAIQLYGQNDVISSNLFVGNNVSIALSASDITIFANNITGSVGQYGANNDYGYGIELELGCNNTSIYQNNIIGNSIGVNLPNSLIYSPDLEGEPNYRGSNNTVYNNNFIGNIKNVNVGNVYFGPQANSVEVKNGTTIVSWDNGSVGNYWGDYNGYENYSIDGNNTDYFPLSDPVNIEISTVTLSGITSNGFDASLVFGVASGGVAVVAAVVLLVYFKRHRHTP